MRRLRKNLEDSELLTALRRKLFITAAYLAVAFSMLMLVSYGQYKIKVEGEVNMPKAAIFEADLGIDYDQTETVGQPTYLTDLQPGDSAREYASDYKSENGSEFNKRKIVVEINNSHKELDDEEQVVTTRNEVSTKYTIRIETTGTIPLEFVLLDGSDTYISKPDTTDTKIYKFYKVTNFGLSTESIATTEAEFTMDNSATEPNTYNIFVGWNNEEENATNLTSASYRKETEMLNVKVELTSTDSNYTDKPDATQLIELIPNPNPSPDPDPEPSPSPEPES